MVKYASCLVLFAACAGAAGSVEIDPAEVPDDDDKTDSVSIPDVQCAGVPDAGAAEELRHLRSRLVIELGAPHHRGFDLIASAASGAQTIAGAISYGLIDKALEDEDVDVFACRHNEWQRIGRTRTDDEGQFALVLEGSERLPIGMRDMFVSVAGDRTGERFLAVVAADNTGLAISDVDGTLTTSENSVAGDVVGIEAEIHDGAAAGWQHIASSGHVPVYVTARPHLYTQDTRDWLARKAMPRGPLRLAPHVLLPGSSTVDYKSRTLSALELPIALGVGNRGSDLEAYANAGVHPDRIFIKLPEFESEVADQLAAGQAVGFAAYPGPLGNL